ncbi:MAG TPA: Ldh family oxidoreductase [Xanthobacteraceae bacterium]|jgi:LDH2 family malate/lactate/ureidoglycolate dehydrogenase|nr:Ldh family oxidoreductase [Xanthobacteraceae bacterium]
MDDETLTRVPSRATEALINDSLVAAGLPAADAARCAELMTEADLTGADGHGIFRLPQYIRRLEAKGFNKTPNITVARTAPATALVDGDNGMGHLVMSRATTEAIAIAREQGTSFVGVRRSNHAGPAGLYAEMPAAAGLIAIYAAVANANHMATWGGADHLLGTNPLAIGVPSGNGPLVFDMATSIVAYGTVKKYALRGLTMPEGWFVNPDTGVPITDPSRSSEGMLLPMGEYKGSGLALMLGLIAGVLNGAAFGRDVVDFNADDKSETNTGHFLCVVDIARFLPLAAFTAEVDRHLRDLRESKRLPGVDAIRLPGDRRAESRAERLRDGVPLAPQLIAQLDKLAAELKIKPLLAR